jgi:uncharacterized membrane protein
MIAACVGAIATLVPIAMYQTGLLNHVPDPPGSVFASDRIAASSAAHPLGVPDSLLGLGSYGGTLALLLMARKSHRGRLLLGGKLAIDGSAAIANVVRQITGFRRLCSWCTGAALATLVMVVAGRKIIAQSTAEITSIVKRATR